MQQRHEVSYATCTRSKENFANTMLLLHEFRGIAHTVLSAAVDDDQTHSCNFTSWYWFTEHPVTPPGSRLMQERTYQSLNCSVAFAYFVRPYCKSSIAETPSCCICADRSTLDRAQIEQDERPLLYSAMVGN